MFLDCFLYKIKGHFKYSILSFNCPIHVQIILSKLVILRILFVSVLILLDMFLF